MPTKDMVRSADGTEIEFEWVYEGADRVTWALEDSHFPEPFTPMELWLYGNGEPGTDRAYAEAEIEPSARFFRFQFAGPFQYARQLPWGDERDRQSAASSRAVLERYGSLNSFWREFGEPRVRDVVDRLRDPDGSEPLSTVAERWAYGWWQTFASATAALAIQPDLARLLSDHFDESELPLLLYEVRQGGENISQAIDGEVDELASIARRDGIDLDGVQGDEGSAVLAVLREDSAAEPFMGRFEAFVQTHADRSFRWDIQAKTWGEAPEVVLGMIAARAKAPTDYAAGRAASLARRDAARERVFAALSPEKRAEFQRLLDVFEGFVGFREDRSYWQMTVTGATRLQLLRRADRLVAGGHLASADDILYVLPSEFEHTVVADLAERAATRRAEWEQWRQVVPPHVIGGASEAGSGADAASGPELKGVAASRGSVTGRARVIRSEEDGVRLQEGEILVCTMTTPAWTPIIAFAAGVVTETGGPMSHPAIVSREYGIPCVAGVAEATTRIPDGAMVTVDGTTGVVQVES